MSFLDSIFDNKVNKQNKYSSEYKTKKEQDELEKKMSALDLEEFEKEEVRKGLANPEDFEYDGQEDDDYYKDSV